MKLVRRQFLRLAGPPSPHPLCHASPAAHAYPTRPVRLIVGNAPGGGPDILARLVGPWLSDRLGQPVIIENVRLMLLDAGPGLTPETVDREAHLRRALGRSLEVEWLAPASGRGAARSPSAI